MAQKYSFIKVEGSFITCNNKIITASASASATGNTIEEADNSAYIYAKQNLELSAQQNALENNLIIKKLIKIKTVIATNINNTEEISNEIIFQNIEDLIIPNNIEEISNEIVFQNIEDLIIPNNNEDMIIINIKDIIMNNNNNNKKNNTIEQEIEYI